ncbi:MAG: histidine kinase [Gorillibacterium sp.]|nr:histidine kinase [Gorillibacterium sp.]
MSFLNSLRFKLLLGFFLILAPLIGLLYYNNVYSIFVVREQVSESHTNLLNMYVQQTDKVLSETFINLIQMDSTEYSELRTFDLLPYNSDDYNMARIRISNQLKQSIRFNTIAYSYFVYSPEKKDLILATNSPEREANELILRNMPEFMKSATESFQWMLLIEPEGSGLVKIHKTQSGLYVGAWIKMERLVETLAFWDAEQNNGGATIMSKEGKPLVKSTLSENQLNAISESLLQSESHYRLFKDPIGKSRYLQVSSKSTFADIYYVITVPEEKILKNLPFFQRIIRVLPIIVLMLILAGAFFFHKVMYKPVLRLMIGMRQLASGNLHVRLKQSDSYEFRILMTSFNQMASQLEDLKIHVYEEQLKAQKAEMKHLQAQINPHFYMNSLNIVSSLADLKEYELIKKMSMHLVDYFRFIIKTNRAMVTIVEEMEHISNYLEIQRVRFPEVFDYEIIIPAELQTCMVPALTVQPFVENAVIHGLGMEDKQFLIRISAMIDKNTGMLTLTIVDNGCGMPEKVLAMFQSGQYTRESGDKHIGIRNVYNRLNMQFSGQSQISFRNLPEGGLEVIVCLPIQEKDWGE